MVEDGFLIQYDGGDADHHAIDMRLLGESLQGIDRIVSDLIVIASARRLPKRGERAILAIKANEPKQGSVEILAILQESAGFLQLGWQVFGPNGADIITNWFKAVLLFHSGRKSEAEQAMQHVADLATQQTKALQEVENNRHQEVMGMLSVLRLAVERLGPSAVQTVAPVGPSVRKLWFWNFKRETPLEISNDDAERIREKAELEWGPLQTYVLQTDGFVFHTRKLSVEHPERTGYLLAEVEDPIAEQENNPYATAVQRKARISVQAKAGYRSGNLERLVILDFGGEIEDAA